MACSPIRTSPGHVPLAFYRSRAFQARLPVCALEVAAVYAGRPAKLDDVARGCGTVVQAGSVQLPGASESVPAATIPASILAVSAAMVPLT